MAVPVGVIVIVIVIVIVTVIMVVAVPATGLVAALDVVVMRFLRQADFGLEAQNLLPVLTVQAVHDVLPSHALFDPVLEGIEHQIVVVEITGLDELQAGESRRNFIGLVVDAVDQHAGEQEVGEDHDPLEAEHGAFFQRRDDQREGHAGVSGFSPAEAQPFPQHTGDLGHVGVGIGVGRTATDDDQQGFMRGDLALLRIGALDRLADALTGCTDHLVVDPQLAAIVHFDVVLGAVGVEHRGNVVLGVACREQHAGHGEDPLTAFLPQAVETVADNRGRELQITIINVELRHAGAQALGHLRKLTHGPFIAATVAAYHYACLHDPCSPVQ
ncbi:MAG: Uncharacterised protein [Rhodospirillaceae bacterium]|nr:MAG: Uncharacterised protein [Rhodospirillaceae bacterium]